MFARLFRYSLSIVVGTTFQARAASLEPRVLLRATGVSPAEYKAFLATEPSFTSFSDFEIRRRSQLKGASEKLKRAIFVAQDAFLKSSVAEAQSKFTELYAMVFAEDWGEEDREAFFYAALRLAHLATDEVTRNRWLNEAASRGQNLIVQESLIPPPIVDAFRARKAQLRPEKVDLDLLFPEFQYVLVDGQRIAIAPQVEILRDEVQHRFTLLSDEVEEQTMVASWAHFLNWRPELKSFANGSCENPRIAKAAQALASAEVYYGDDCIVSTGLRAQSGGSISLAQAVAPPSPSPPPSLLNLSQKAPLDYFVGGAIDAASSAPAGVETSLKNRWVWASLGLGIIAALAYNQSRRQTAEPQTTYGF